MPTELRERRRQEAATAFDEYEHRDDGMRIVSDLADGFRRLCDAFFTRIQADVEREIGRDSMLMPLSAIKAEVQTRREIDLFQIAESAACADEHQYVHSADWYLHWLGRLRLGDEVDAVETAESLAAYHAHAYDERKGAFSTKIDETFPQSRRAPLVLYQLFPLAVKIVTATAFGDGATALAARRTQTELLPIIADCKTCHGRILEVGESCQSCGNPLWKYSWLTAE